MWHEGSSCVAYLSAWHQEVGVSATSWRHRVLGHVEDGRVGSFPEKAGMETDESADGVEHMLIRICGEYLEMPGLRLTCAQAERLWALDADICRQLLEVLVESRFLWRTKDGAYARLTESSVSTLPLRTAKADIRAKAIWGKRREELDADSG